MKYLIVGNGNYARMLCRYLKNTENVDVSGYTVEKKVISAGVIDNIPVVPAEDINRLYNPSACKLLMGIGYRSMNIIKEREFHRYKGLGYHFCNYIHPTAIIEKDVMIGEANNIFEGVIIQNGVRIGDANLIYGGTLIAHENMIGNYNSISVKACVAGCSQIGNNCFIGANSTIRDHIMISDFTLVGAGTYVDTNTKPYDVIVTAKAKILDGRSSLEFI